MSLLKRLLSKKTYTILLVLFASFSVKVKATNYYLKPSGTLTTVGDWATNTDGINGTHPTNFTAASQVFTINNNSSITLSSAWTVSGSGSKVILGDGTNSITLTLSSILTATIDVSNNATLSIGVTTIPTLGTIGNTSTTVDYSAAGNQTIPTKTYCNLTTSGSGTKTLSTNITVNGILTINATTSASAAINMTLTNDIAGTKTLFSPANINFTFNGTSSCNLPNNWTVLKSATINNTGGVYLNSDIGLAGTLTLSTGNFYVRNNKFTFNANIGGVYGVLGGTTTNFKTDSTSTLILNNNGVLIPSSVTDLKELDIHYGNVTGVVLTSNIKVHNKFTYYGNLDNGTYLSLKNGATIEKSTSYGTNLTHEPTFLGMYNLTYTGSATYGNGNAYEVATSPNKINNLTVNSTGGGVVGSNKGMTINGDLIILTGGGFGCSTSDSIDLVLKGDLKSYITTQALGTFAGQCILFAGTDSIIVAADLIIRNMLISGTVIAPNNYKLIFYDYLKNYGNFVHNFGTVKLNQVGAGYVTSINSASTTNTSFYNFEIQSAAYLSANSNNFSITGNFIKNFPSPSGNHNYAISFVGDSIQIISGSGTIDLPMNVNINKTGGKVILNYPINILDTLILTSGKIYTDSVNVLSFKSGSKCIRSNDSSYIKGPAIKIGNTPFDFPFQKKLSISASAVVTDSWRAEYFNTGQTIGSTLASTLTNLSNCEYWKIKRMVGTSSIQTTLNWDTYSCRIKGDIERMRVSQYNSGTWIDLGDKGTIGDSIKGNVLSVTATTGGYYTLAQSLNGFKHYYLKSTGSITTLSDWGLSTDGSGANPTNFTSADQIFHIVNSSTKTLSSVWTVSGLSSRIVLGNGTDTITLIQNSNITTAPLDLKAKTVLKINSNAVNLRPFGNIDINSTVNYSAPTVQTVFDAVYGNFTTSGTGQKTNCSSCDVTVNGVLTLGATLYVGSGRLLTFTNDIQGTKTYLYPSNNLKINGTSPVLLPTNYTGGNILEINNTGGVTLASSITIPSQLILTAGNFNIGANTLTLNYMITGTPTNLKSTNSSNLVINTGNAFAIPTSITELNDLNVLTANGSATSLSASVNIYGTFTKGRGLLVNSSYLNMQPNTNVVFAGASTLTGTLTGELNAVSYYNLTYSTTGSGNTTTGYELPSTTTMLKNLTINSDNDSRRFTINKNIKVNGAITITKGILNLSSYTVDLEGNFTNSTTNAGFEAATSTVKFVGNTTVSTTDENEFNNITITDTLKPSATQAFKIKGNMVNNGFFNNNGGTTKFSGTTTLSGSSTTEFGNLTILSSSALTLGTGLTEIKLDGNFSNSGTFTHNNKKLSFEGSGLQTISSTSALTLYDFAIKKPSNNLQLSVPVALSHVLTFIGGNLVTDSTNILTFNSGSSHTGLSSASYIQGPVRKKGNTAFVFPLIKPLAISATTSSTNEFYAKYCSTNPKATEPVDDSLGLVSSCESWKLYETTGTDSVRVTLTWDASSCDIASDTTDIRLANYKSGLWKSLGKQSVTGTSTAGSATATARLLPEINGTIIGPAISIIPILRQSTYSKLEDELSSAYINVTTLPDNPTYLKVAYEERYAAGAMTYKIINPSTNATVISNTTQPLTKQLGFNRHLINVTSLSNGYYTLVISNVKNQKQYLRFKKI